MRTQRFRPMPGMVAWCAGLSIALSASQAWAQGGVYVDPDGVMRPAADNRAEARRLARLREAVRPVDGPVAATSKLRKVSLPRLQEQLRTLKQTGQALPDELRYLGGITRVEYVFAYPEEGDLVIAGPAEPWRENAEGEIVGQETGQPVLHLDDLVVALRSVGPGGTAGGVGCSIDPTQQGLARYRDFLRNLPPFENEGQARHLFRRMAEQIGLQDVVVYGVAPETHFARVMVEADYRMKRVSLDLERTGVRNLKSGVELCARNGSLAVGDKLYRWWFTPDYDAIFASDDRLSFQLRGQGLQLLAEDQLISATGQRQGTGQADAIADGFARSFTDAFPELCKKRAIFASLRNVTDLAVVAALIRQEQLPQKVRWSPDGLLDPEVYAPQAYPTPKQADSLANARKFTRRFSGGRAEYLAGVAGGVSIEPAGVIDPAKFQTAGAAGLPKQRGEARSGTPEYWWWD